MNSLHSFWHATTAFTDRLVDVGFRALAIALVFHFANLLLRATAWRNILQAAHPQSRVRWRTVTGAYLSGVGTNSVVPARGGDVMKVYLAHRGMPDAPYTTIVTSLITETLFDVCIGSVLLVWAYTTGRTPSMPNISSIGAFEWSFFIDHSRVFLTILAVLLIAAGIGFTWIEHHVTAFWMRFRDGLAILRSPHEYLRRVVALQGLGWICRVLSMYFFLQAFGIPAGVPDALLALATASVTTLLPLTPGGVGTQQALLVVIFRGLAPATAVLSFSVGMQFTVTLANAIVGGTCIAVMLRRLPWRANVPKPEPGPAPVKP